MGIRGVWSCFKQHFQPIQPERLESQRIGIDMFSLVYTHRDSLDDLLNLIKGWGSKHTVTCIWDGTAPKEKQEIIAERRSTRDTAKEKKGELEVYLAEHGSELAEDDIVKLNSAIENLSWKSWHLTGTLKKEIQVKLGPGIDHIFAPGEADDLLIEMTFNKEIDIVLSLDSDLFAMGSPRIWRLMKKRSFFTEEISVEKVCNDWGISLSMLQDASYLAGWDRCHPTAGEFIPFSKALSLVKFYGKLQIILEKNNIEATQESLACLKQLKAESKARWLKVLAN